jgi:hypothetical protein
VSHFEKWSTGRGYIGIVLAFAFIVEVFLLSQEEGTVMSISLNKSGLSISADKNYLSIELPFLSSSTNLNQRPFSG